MTNKGGRRLSSLDGSGFVELKGHKQTCDVGFSVEVGNSKRCQHPFTATRQSTKGATESDVYMVAQKHSVVAATSGGVPQWWHYPLSLLLGATPSPGPSIGPRPSDCTLPGVLHGLCSRTHLHKWAATVSASSAMSGDDTTSCTHNNL